MNCADWKTLLFSIVGSLLGGGVAGLLSGGLLIRWQRKRSLLDEKIYSMREVQNMLLIIAERSGQCVEGLLGVNRDEARATVKKLRAYVRFPDGDEFMDLVTEVKKYAREHNNLKDCWDKMREGAEALIEQIEKRIRELA